LRNQKKKIKLRLRIQRKKWNSSLLPQLSLRPLLAEAEARQVLQPPQLLALVDPHRLLPPKRMPWVRYSKKDFRKNTITTSEV